MILLSIFLHGLTIPFTLGINANIIPFKRKPIWLPNSFQGHRHQAVPDSAGIAWSDEVRKSNWTTFTTFDAAKAHRHHLPFKAWLTGCYVIGLLAHGVFRTWFCTNSTKKDTKNAGHIDPTEPASETVGPPVFSYVQLAQTIVVVVTWMVASIVFVIFNKYLFTAGGFPNPTTLTALHMGSCFLVFGAVSWLPNNITAKIMPDLDKEIPWMDYLKEIVPTALLFAISLAAGNFAFFYASVVFIQMVKPVNIVFTSLFGFIWGLEPATLTHMMVVLVIAVGVFLAAYGDAEFSLMGLICKLIATSTQGLRLVLLQVLTQRNIKLDPVTTVYRIAPVSAVALSIVACIIEQPVKWDILKYPWVLVLNCLGAVCLNVLIVGVILKTSAMVYSLAGIFKDIITIIISAIIFSTHLSALEYVGYTCSICGIWLFKVYKDNLPLFKTKGFFFGLGHVFSTNYDSAAMCFFRLRKRS